MKNIQIGLVLMAVGMTTVFAILLVVSLLGKALTALVNKYAPEEIIVKKQAGPRPAMAAAVPVGNQAVSVNHQAAAAIIAAVSVVTKGKGKGTKNEKL